jgi:asparagine synthase (glutamine-hydrolysing)
MYRFIAFLWNPDDKQCLRQAQTLAEQLLRSLHDWQQVLKVEGLFIFHDTSTIGATSVYELHDHAGVVLGKVFRQSGKGTGDPAQLISHEEFSRAVIDSRGQHLVDCFWGRYIAFLWDRIKQKHYVLRDPTGGVPCMFTETSGIRVFMSDMEDYFALGGDQRHVNWTYLAALFWNLRLISRDTGFEGVSQLYAGERLTIPKSGAASLSFSWLPSEIIESGPVLERADEARAALKLAVRHSVASWASSYTRIIHQLSGGLDSAIVAACLSSAPNKKEIVCVNLSTETSEGDERYFARLASLKAGLALVESAWVARGQALGDLLDTGKHYSPIGLHSETDRVLESLVHEQKVTGIFSGQGGDHLFHQHCSAFVSAEFVFHRGLQPGLMQIIVDTSRLTGRSVWPILGIAITHGLLRRAHNPFSDYAPSVLLSNDARSTLTPDLLIHPWVSSSAGLPASKVEQISLIVDSQHFYLRGFPFADAVHPLISQPVIECCLRIPSYVLTRGGIRRSLVREAFQQEVPSEIITRIAKGGTTSYLNRLAVENIDFLRNLLLDGLLVSSHLLDKPELERQLCESRLIRGHLLPDVLLAARMETWLRSCAEAWPNCAS